MAQDAVLLPPDGEELGPEGPALGGDGIEFPRPLLADVPLAPDPAVLLEAAEQGIEGVLLDLVTLVPDGPDHRVAVGLRLEKGQHQDLEEPPVHLGFEASDVGIHGLGTSFQHERLILCAFSIMRII